MISGLDVSAHQDTTPSLVGRSFLIARAAYGTVVDERFASHIRAARRADLVTGAYLFLRHGNVAAQVRTFLEVAGDVDLYAVDQESDGGSTPATADEARQAIELTQAAGHPCGLYHSTSGYPHDSLGASWRWVADYRPIDEPPVPWDVWQRRGSPLDLDVFRGTKDQLRQLGGSDMRFVKVIDGKVLPVLEGEHWLYTDGSAGGSFSADDRIPVVGSIDARAGQWLCRVTTGRPYDDGRARPTDVLVRSSRDLIDAPPPLPPVVDCDDVVTRELDAAAARAAEAVRSRP